MPSMSPGEVFLRLVHGVSDRAYATLPELYAERTDVRHPMSPLGAPPLTTRDDLRRHFGVGVSSSPVSAAALASPVRFRPENIRIHETVDPEVIVAEFEYRGAAVDTGEPFAVPCVFVLRVRDGLVVESRDYIDHVAFARARGTLGDLLDALRPCV